MLDRFTSPQRWEAAGHKLHFSNLKEVAHMIYIPLYTKIHLVKRKLGFLITLTTLLAF